VLTTVVLPNVFLSQLVVVVGHRVEPLSLVYVRGRDVVGEGVRKAPFSGGNSRTFCQSANATSMSIDKMTELLLFVRRALKVFSSTNCRIVKTEFSKSAILT